MRWTMAAVLVAAALAGCVGGMEEDVAPPAEEPEPRPAPNMAFSKDNAAGTVTVVKAPEGADAITWGDLSLGGACADEMQVNEGAADPAANVRAGDRIGTCAAGDTLTISHTATGTLLYQTTFS